MDGYPDTKVIDLAKFNCPLVSALFWVLHTFVFLELGTSREWKDLRVVFGVSECS